MQTHTITTYEFDELSDDAKQAAVESLYDINVSDSFWHEYVIDDVKRIGALLGIDIDDVFFSGFSSQGDGAMCTGRYQYRISSVQKIQTECPQDETLHDIAERLRDLQRRYFYSLYAEMSHRGHYYHSGCADISVYDDGEGRSMYAPANVDEELCDILRDFMDWSYRRLEDEYGYLTSEDAITETIRANEYQFTEDGQLC